MSAGFQDWEVSSWFLEWLRLAQIKAIDMVSGSR